MNILFCIYQLDYADHISLAYLSAVAKKLGHNTNICILSDCDLNDKITSYRPDIVAYSTNIYGYDHLLASHKAAARKHDFISIMGGPHVTIYPELYATAEADFFCAGEGELAFAEVLQHIEAGKNCDGVANIISAQGANPVRPLIMELDEIPFPDRDLTLANSYLRDTPKKTFYATRGCPFNCKYCANNFFQELYSGKWSRIRRFSVNRIIDEVHYVKNRYRTDFIKFGDDLFAIKADQWLEEFAERYSKEIGIPFNCYLRVDRIDRNLLELLKMAGCYSVHLSVDSTSEHVREKVLGRRMKKVDIESTLKLVRNYGINTWVNFMLAAPDSTFEDDLSTIELSKRADVTYPAFSTTVPMPGTALYDDCLRKGLIKETDNTGDMTGIAEKSMLSCFTEKDKDARLNIYLLGALAAKSPKLLQRVFLFLIKHIPPNKLFRWMRNKYYVYNIENKIFKLNKHTV
ncbi:MAG: radical SAM protein [Thermodesulfobacteriota bacterium]